MNAENRRTVKIQVRLSEAENTILEEKSRVTGVSKSEIIRRGIHGFAVIADRELVETIRKYIPILRRDSANLNQSLKYLHAHPSKEKYIQDFINDVIKHEKDFSNFVKGM